MLLRLPGFTATPIWHIIPMAKAFGVRVIATVLSAQIAMSIKHLNADLVVDTSKDGISKILENEYIKGHGVDVAVDCLVGEIMEKCLHYLSHGARWIMIASLAGNLTEIDLENIYVRNVRIIGSTLRSRDARVKAQILKRLTEEIFPLITKGDVKPTIYKVLPIERAEEAHGILYRGENVGKAVLKVK